MGGFPALGEDALQLKVDLVEVLFPEVFYQQLEEDLLSH